MKSEPTARRRIPLLAGLALALVLGSAAYLDQLPAWLTRIGGSLPGAPSLAVPPILDAVLARDVARVRELVAGGIDPNASGPIAIEVLRQHGATIDGDGELDSAPLLLAAFVGEPAMIDALLELGADPRVAAPDGSQAIHLAADLGHDAAIATLLRHGVAVDARNANGMTPLMMAAREGRGAAVQSLLLAGAAVDQAANAGETALIGAIENGSLELVQILLAAGASAERGTTDDGLPPLLLAVARGNVSIVERLVAAGADVAAVRTISSDALMDLGADTEPGQRIEVTPLMLAALKDDRKMVESLLHLGAKLDTVTNEGITALLVAVLESKPELVAWFLRRGADPNASGEAATPLLVAIDRKNSEIAAMLLAAGADPNRANEDGLTPLRAAREQGLEAFAKQLEESGGKAESASQRARANVRVDTLGISATPPPPGMPASLLPLGLALDAQGQWIYWSEYRANRIRRARRDGSETTVVVDAEADGPFGIGLDPAGAQLCWASDSAFPRRVRCRRLADGVTEVLTEGVNANLPRALAVGSAGTFWTEAVSGRVRFGVYGKPVVDLVTSGISSTADRADHRPFESLGLAIDETRGLLFWSELTLAQLEVSTLDGKDHRILFDADDGLSFPAGVAVDAGRGQLYWADVAHEAIYRAALDGGPLQRILGPEQGLVEPQAVAVDTGAAKIYWTDASRDILGRANLDGSAVEELALAALPDARFRDRPQNPPSTCAELGAAQAELWVLRVAKRISTCLEKVDAIKAVKRSASDAKWAVATCSQQLDGLDPADPASLAAATAMQIESACDNTLPEAPAGCDASACRDVACILRACRAHAWQRVGARYPRAAEWLEEVRPFIEEAGAAESGRVLARIDEGMRFLEASTVSGRGVLPASGLQTSYRAQVRGATSPVAVADDARLRLGQPMRFVDHGDGTVTDQVTGLMWEKKCDGCSGLHNVNVSYPWSGDGISETVWDWLADLNEESGAGFAGYSDWRLPNVKELQSLIDYERFNPAVSAAFDGARCGFSCGDVTQASCSCTAMSTYWSSTTFADGSGRAFVVMFHLGLIGDVPKEDGAYVRAVRAGHAQPAANP